MKKIITTKSGKQLELVANFGTDQFYKIFTGNEIECDAITLKEMKEGLKVSKEDDKTILLQKISVLTLKMSKTLAFVMATQAKYFPQDGYVRKTMDDLTEEKFTEFLCQYERSDFDAEFYKEIFALWNGQSESTSEIKNLTSRLQES